MIDINIRKYRLENNMTQQDLADQLFVTRQCISRWEQGKGLPDIYQLENIAKIFKININDLLDEHTTKMLVVENTNKGRKRDQMNFVSMGVAAVAILLSISIYFLFIHSNGNETEDILNVYRGEVVNHVALDYIELDSNGLNIVLSYDELGIAWTVIYDHKDQVIDLTDIKVGDYVEVKHYGYEKNERVQQIKVVDSVVEKSIYGVFLATNGVDYTSEEELPTSLSLSEWQTDSYYGFSFYYYHADTNSKGGHSNLDSEQVNYTIDADIYFYETIFEITFYVNRWDVARPLRRGIITSEGLEWIEDVNLSQLYVIQGEVNYDSHQNVSNEYVRFSEDVTYNINIVHMEAVDSIDIYEYDQNNELIKTTSISTFVEIREFEADANTLYARIKLNYTYSSVVYDVNLGGKVELYYQDLYGIVGKDQLNLK